jgi:hypothetical protein
MLHGRYTSFRHRTHCFGVVDDVYMCETDSRHEAHVYNRGLC